MRNHEHALFYIHSIKDNIIRLDATEAHHAASVMRLHAGDTISATNGSGSIYTCKCINLNSKELTAEIISTTVTPRIPLQMTFFVGIPDRDAFEEIITNLTPLGIYQVYPVVTEHCRKFWWDSSWEKSHTRFHLKMTTAMKQSLYPWELTIHSPVSLSDALKLSDARVYLADPEGIALNSVDKFNLHNEALSVFVGPPGGFSEKEISTLHQRGALGIKIAQSRLRTELATTVFASQLTAALISCQ